MTKEDILRSAFLLSRAVQPHILEMDWGRIIHIGSKTGVEPRSRQVGYAVSKMGVITLTEVLAAEVKGTSVTANIILPSVMDTPANRAAMRKANRSRWVAPDRIAATMRFLCSDAAASISGARIRIYGAIKSPSDSSSTQDWAALRQSRLQYLLPPACGRAARLRGRSLVPQLSALFPQLLLQEAQV